MLEQILDYIHNYFIKEVYRGTFVIESGSINLDFLQNGQYFKVVGSVFNDGVHKYPDDELTDETFTGEIWAMAVPPSVIALSVEIQDWVTKYGETTNSPFNSESFGGYSYTKGGTGNGDNAGTWQGVFGSRLSRWKKIS